MYLEINFEREALILSYEKARTIKPRVVPSRNLSAFACYDVMCPSERVWFSVMFTRSIDGKPVGHCKCAAGENGDYCYHLAAAVYLHCGLVQHGLCRPITDSIWSPISEEPMLENEGAVLTAPLFFENMFRRIRLLKFNFYTGKLLISHSLEMFGRLCNSIAE